MLREQCNDVVALIHFWKSPVPSPLLLSSHHQLLSLKLHGPAMDVKVGQNADGTFTLTARKPTTDSKTQAALGVVTDDAAGSGEVLFSLNLDVNGSHPSAQMLTPRIGPKAAGETIMSVAVDNYTSHEGNKQMAGDRAPNVSRAKKGRHDGHYGNAGVEVPHKQSQKARDALRVSKYADLEESRLDPLGSIPQQVEKYPGDERGTVGNKENIDSTPTSKLDVFYQYLSSGTRNAYHPFHEEKGRMASVWQSATTDKLWSIAYELVPGGPNGRLATLWHLFGNEAICIGVALFEVVMLAVNCITTERIGEALEVGGHLFNKFWEEECKDRTQSSDSCWKTISTRRAWAATFLNIYIARSVAEIMTLFLAVVYAKYRRVGVTPLSLEWQPGNKVDLYAIPTIQFLVACVVIAAVDGHGRGFRPGSYSAGTPLDQEPAAAIFVIIVYACMMLVSVATVTWVFTRRESLAHCGKDLIAASTISQTVAFTWEVCSALVDLTYIPCVGSGGPFVAVLLSLEVVRTLWELHMEFKSTKLTYIFGKLIVPARAVKTLQSLNTDRSEALKSNAKFSGIIAVTTRLSTSENVIQEILKLVPVLSTGPMIGGEWYEAIGGEPRPASFEVWLAVMPLTDSSHIWRQGKQLAISLANFSSVSLSDSLVVKQDGSVSRKDIPRFTDAAARLTEVHIVH